MSGPKRGKATVEPYFPEIEFLKIADIITVSIQNPEQNNIYYQMLSFYAAQREHPQSIITKEEFHEAIELNNESFTSVFVEEKEFTINGVKHNFITYFNKEYGLIGFNDFEEMMWVFDGFE